MPIHYPSEIEVDTFTDALEVDSPERQARLSQERGQLRAQRSSDGDEVVRNRVVRRYCGVKQLWLEVGTERSASFSPTRARQHRRNQWDRTHTTVTNNDARRVNFLPGDPSNATLGTGGEVCTIKYDLRSPSCIRRAKLELFRPGDPVALMSVRLDYVKANARLEPHDPSGPVRLRGDDLIWDGRLSRVVSRVGGQVIDVGSSPYKLKLSVTPTRGIQLDLAEAWTYFDVLVDSLTLEWGDAAVIPLNRADVDARFETEVRAHQVQLMRHLAAHAAGPHREIDGNDHALALDSNLFCTEFLVQVGTDLPFRSYREMWGHGPLLPVFVKIVLAKSDGGAVQASAAPWALGKTELLWDWEDSPDHKVAQWAAAAPQRTRHYLDNVLDYLVELEAEAKDAPLDSNNCHVHHGGKRGHGAAPVFPNQTPVNYAPATPALIAREFPFEVGPCALRRWAAKSKARTTGVLAGQTGAMFQPSRIGGDRYRVAVYLLTHDFPHDETGANLRACPIPHAATGVFEVRRRVKAWVYQADGTVGNVNQATVRDIFEEARVELELALPAAVDVGRWQDAFHLGLSKYMPYVSRPWFGVMLPTAQAGPDCVQLVDPTTAVARVHALVGAGLWEVDVTGGANEHSLKPGEPVEHLPSNTRGFVVHREVQVGGLRLYLDHALGQHLALGQTLTVTRGAIAMTVIASHRVTAAVPQQQLEITLNALCDTSLRPDNYGLLAKNLASRVMKQYAKSAHANDKAVFLFLFEQMASYANEPRAGGTNSTIASEQRAFAYLQDDPAVVGGGPLKGFDFVAAHEVGHALFLPHSPPEGDAKKSVHIAVPTGELDNCIMNYEPAAQHLCGMCIVRLMGWSMHGTSEPANADPALTKLSNEDDGNKREFVMEALTATLPVTPPRTVRTLHNSTSLNLPTRPSADGAASVDLAANPPLVLLTDSANQRPALADPQRQAVCGLLRLEARAQMPDGASYVWKVERAADDDDRVVAASPSALPNVKVSGPNSEFAEIETNATGTFHVKASVNTSGGPAFDDALEFLCVNLVLVKTERLESDHKTTKHPGGCWHNHGDIFIGTQQGTASAPLRLKTKIKLIGGGPDGRRGLDEVSAGWINNLRSDDTGATYSDNTGDGWTACTLPLHRDGPGMAYARINPEPGANAPIVDKNAVGNMDHWTPRHGVLSVAQPNPQDPLSMHITAKAIGGHCWIRAEDAPAQGWDVHPPTQGTYDIERLWLHTQFTAYLCLWTHSAPRLVGVLEELPWQINSDYDVDVNGPRQRRIKLVLSTFAKTKHATLVSAVATNLEWCPPGSLNLYVPRYMPDNEDLATDLGFRWDTPTVR